MVKTINYSELEGEYVLVDVRSPKEYEEATIPGAINIPLFTNEERALIGTVYKQQSTEKAKRLGVEAVSKKLPQIFNDLMEIHKQHKKIVLFCARGGMRSGSLAALLNSLGLRVERIKDGYKGYRAFINESLPKVNEGVKYIVDHSILP